MLHLLNPFFALNPAWRAKLWQIINLYEPQCVFFVLNTFFAQGSSKGYNNNYYYSFPKSVQYELNEYTLTKPLARD